MIRRNLIANLSGRGLSALLNILFIPIYLKLMGIEAYGLVGIWMTISATLLLFDGGLGMALNRELARGGDLAKQRNLLRTMESMVWAGAIVVMLLSLILKKPLFIAMGCGIGIHFTIPLYRSGLMGGGKQPLQNVLTTIFVLLRGGAQIGVLLVWATPIAFFIAGALVLLMQSLSMRAVLWHSLALDHRPTWGLHHLKRVASFGLGVNVASLLAASSTHLDKIILSAVLPLKAFGLYSVAWSLASGLHVITCPIFSTFYPKLSELVAKNEAVSEVFHKACRLLALLTFPIAAILIFFSREVLLLWTQSVEIAEGAHLLLSVMTCGLLLHSCTSIPYALQLAHGYTKLSVWQNVIATLLFVPLLFTSGLVGAAFVWLGYNLFLFVTTALFFSRKFLPGDRREWLVKDIAVPVCVIFISVWVVACQTTRS